MVICWLVVFVSLAAASLRATRSCLFLTRRHPAVGCHGAKVIMSEQWEVGSSDDDLEITSVVRRDLGHRDDLVGGTCLATL